MAWRRGLAVGSAIGLSASLLIGAPAAAQFWAPNSATLFSMGSSQLGLQNMELSRQNLNAAIRSPADRPAAAPTSPRASTTFTPSGPPVVPARMAQVAPAADRTTYRQGLEGLLKAHRDAAAQLGVPANDVAGALTHFMVGNYYALTGRNPTEPQIRAVLAQLHATLAADPAFARTSDRQRQEMFEGLATVGALMDALAQRQQQTRNPAAAVRLAAQARLYLEQLLGRDAARLRITDRGLALG